MIVTIELSLYPLSETFDIHILDFIKKLRSYPELEVFSNPVSTYIKGEWKQVMHILTIELESIYTKVDTTSTVIKVINRDLPIDQGYYNMN